MALATPSAYVLPVAQHRGGRKMPRKPRKVCEYRFEIDAYTPETIPLSRLSQYLGDLARIMGESANVHLVRIEKGSTAPIIRVDW